jgi:hypothetical protein
MFAEDAALRLGSQLEFAVLLDMFCIMGISDSPEAGVFAGLQATRATIRRFLPSGTLRDRQPLISSYDRSTPVDPTRLDRVQIPEVCSVLRVKMRW